MKIKDLLILISFFLIPVIALPLATSAAGSWEDAYGYRVTIWRYDGTGNPTIVKNDNGQNAIILLYTDDLVEEVKKSVGSSSLPGSFDEFVTGDYPVTQIVNFNSPTLRKVRVREKNSNGNWSDVPLDVNYWVGFRSNKNTNNVVDSRTVTGTPESSSSYSHDVTEEVVYFDNDISKGSYKSAQENVKKADREELKSDYNDLTLNYILTNQFYVTYLRGIDNISNKDRDYPSGQYKENNLSTTTIDDLIKNKYCSSIDSIKTYFKLTLKYGDMDKYYASVEPVKRYLPENSSSFYVTGTKYLKSVWKETEPRQQLVTDGSHCSAGYTCKIWSKEENNTCACGVNKCPGPWTKRSCLAGVMESTRKTEWSCQSNSKNCAEGQYWCRSRSKNVKDCNNCDCNTWSAPAISRGVRIVHNFYIRLATSKSQIVVENRDAYKTRAINYCNNIDSKHCELVEVEAKVNGNTATFIRKLTSDKEIGAGNAIISVCKTKDTNGNEKFSSTYQRDITVTASEKWDATDTSLTVSKYQYYIGPNSEKALVGTTSNNPFKLSGDCTNLTAEKGIKHYYLENLIGCKSSCESITNKTSDEYLKCAENYCDAEIDFDLKSNTRVRKRNCIIACGYKGFDRNNCVGDGCPPIESIKTCKYGNPYKNLSNSVNETSSCNISDRNNQNMGKTEAVITSCSGDEVTDFDGNDSNEAPVSFDQRRYINVSCKETTSFNFTDLSKMTYYPGEGIDYTVTQKGNKTCDVFFDTEQWKFDYATISSKDPDRRKRLMYIYTVYNNQLKKDYNVTTNPYYDKDFADQNDGEIHWSDYLYDTSKALVTSKVTEIINNEEVISDSAIMPKMTETGNASQEAYKTETTKMIANMKEVELNINRYRSTSEIEARYKFDKACVKTDGTAGTYKPTGNVCYSTKKENGIVTTVEPRNVYYTSLNATANRDFSDKIKRNNKTHNVEMTVTVGRVNQGEGTYYNINEKCSYKIVKTTTDDKTAKCFVDIKANSGTTLLGKGIYEGGSVTAKVRYQGENLTESDINSISLVINGTKYDGVREKTVAISGANNSVQSFEINGIIKTTGGKEITCNAIATVENKITLLRQTSCGMSCRIDTKTATLHTIENTGTTATTYREFTSDDTNQKKVEKDVIDQKYYVRTNKAVTSAISTIENGETILFGVVESAGGCNNYCRTSISARENCETKYKPGQIGEITRYCNKNYSTDINNYGSPEDCIFRCTKDACPDNCRNENEVQNYCENINNVNAAGFTNKSDCLNTCICTRTGNYTFRQISNVDPFPQSSISPYSKGKREIGKNWYGYTEYITNDKNDESTVTGEDKNRKVEYIIDLDPDTIRNIRRNNEEYGVEGYTSYIYSASYNKEYKSRYKSKFIHDEYSDIFVKGIKSNGKYIEAEGDTK